MITCRSIGDGEYRRAYSDYCSPACASHATKRGGKRGDETVIDAKRRKTMKVKYGHEYNSQRDEVKMIISDNMRLNNPSKPKR
jgi:hypothetical protein